MHGFMFGWKYSRPKIIPILMMAYSASGPCVDPLESKNRKVPSKNYVIRPRTITINGEPMHALNPNVKLAPVQPKSSRRDLQINERLHAN